MGFRAVCWTLGALLAAWIDYATTGTVNVDRLIGFWTGMMLAAVFIHFEPPEIEMWEKGR